MKIFRKTASVSQPLALYSDVPMSGHMGQGDVDKAFARLFSSDDGKIVLSHLQAMTFTRTHGAEASDKLLRHCEGQRALVAHILRLVDRGRRGV